MNIEKELRELVRDKCQHKCHDVGLNDWVKACPICGCENPKYDSEAVSDIKPFDFFDILEKL
jgi:hypothetical protein